MSKEKQTFFVNPPNSAPVLQQQYQIDQLVYPNEHMYYYHHHPHSSIPYFDPQTNTSYYDSVTQSLYQDPYTNQSQLMYPHFQQPQYPYYPQNQQIAYMAVPEPIQPNTTPN